MLPDDQSEGPDRLMVPCRCLLDPPWRLLACFCCLGTGKRPETDEERDHRLNGGGPWWDGSRWQEP
jgi:hypothetical protein